MSQDPQSESQAESQAPKSSPEPLSETIPERKLVLVEYSESVLESLKQFAALAPTDRKLVPELDAVIENIAFTGQVTYPWKLLVCYISFKIQTILDEFTTKNGFTPYNEDDSFDARKKNVFDQLDDFPEAPFTIQRLCEVLIKPTHYTQTNNLLFGLEKLLCVSTVQRAVKPEDIDRINEICKANYETLKKRDEEERKRLAEEAEKRRKQEEEEAEKRNALKAQADSDSEGSEGSEDDEESGGKNDEGEGSPAEGPKAAD